MSASFVAASSQFIQNTAPLLPTVGYPFTLAGWFKTPTASTSQICMGFYASATANGMEILFSSTNVIGQQNILAGVNTSNLLATTYVVDGWYFIIARMISATSRRVHAVGLTGLIESAQSTASNAPPGLNTISVGARVMNGSSVGFLDGNAAEIWYSNTDVWGSDTVPDNAFLWQLAFGGPFSIPSVGPKVVEYRSLREGPVSRRAENKQSNAGAAWVTSASSPGIGRHVPLPYWFKRPAEDISSLAMV